MAFSGSARNMDARRTTVWLSSNQSYLSYKTKIVFFIVW